MRNADTQIGVRYCGGCNPRYDRVGLVKKLASFFPELEFTSAQDAVSYPAVVVVHGCPARCAKVEGLAVAGERLIALAGWEDLLPAKKQLCQALEKKQAAYLNHGQVMDLLPHRDPLLLIDEVTSLVPGQEVVATFHVKPDLPVFQGHFPGQPILPGVYTIEAAAQAADLLLLSLERYAGKTPLFMGVRKANFRKKILPGDTMEIHAVLSGERPETGIATCSCRIFTAAGLAADAEVTLALR